MLQVTGTLDPEYGGPPVVINQLTRSLVQSGQRVDVATLDPPSAPWLSEAPGSTLAFGPSVGGYGYSRRFSEWLSANVQCYDAVVVHGIWGYQSLAVRKACTNSRTPYFVFVHGALDPWFKRRYPSKHVKKWMYWRIFEHVNLTNASAVIYTEEKEQLLARDSFRHYNVKEAIVQLGIDEPEGDSQLQLDAFWSRFPHLRDKRLFLFLSRLHPKKGCDLLMEAFARVAKDDERLHLMIAGPDECNLGEKLREMAVSLGIADRVTWPGMLVGDLKWGAYKAADLFTLISHSENFGIVVVESLACGLPVLTTNKVNIHETIEQSGAGLIGADTVQSAESLMRLWLSKSDEEREDIRRRARSCYSDHFGARRTSDRLLELVALAKEAAGRST